MREFSGRVAVVTGAASGMGRAFAERFAAEGMRVVLADVEERALDAAVSELRLRERDVIGVVTDVSDPAAVERLRDEALDAYGAIHLVCNNAGVLARSDLPPSQDGFGGGGLRLWEQPLEEFTWTFGVNLWGVVHGIRTFVPVLLEQEEGHLVNTASVAGLTTGAYLGIYTATKHAVVALTEALALQLADTSVGVSVLCPGAVRTRIAVADRNQPGHERELAEDETADLMSEAMDPADVAQQVFEAVRDDRFYILTHGDDFDGAVRTRMEAILERRNPGGVEF
jgi:NAD(P)-dependent dehydrogenase (short-subunit alcohol dehydrogenase family)